MKGNKSSVSGKSSYVDMGEYWDTHDLADIWDKTRRVNFEVQIDSERVYYAVEKGLAEQVRAIAKTRGVSSDTLVNLWIQQNLHDQSL
ncbi:MAG: CopG family antitoxin [Candidatus Sumerlaeota bacterium]|nr:CopG family antitoxin [Candidatus Sumerlaeota bacterium]